MPGRPSIFLTGATGFLGQYLLCDLLSSGCSVAVLVRDSRQNSASERMGELLAFWSERWVENFLSPRSLPATSARRVFGLTEVDRNWIGRVCRAILHSAASVSFRESPGGEPWQTNVRGLQTLLDFCLSIGLIEWHHVSTAFVCGRRTGDIGEEELDAGQSFHNCYEESKFQGEKLLRSAKGLQTTFYRPSVIVGDSKTGHTTSYTGLYRFLEMAARLSALHASESNAHVPLRLPLSGTETWNLVTVDWVSRDCRSHASAGVSGAHLSPGFAGAGPHQFS